VFVVSGEAGTGKTTVWAEALQQWRAGGLTALVARAAESEAKPAFTGFTDLLGNVVDEVAAEL
jgi:hypothetical protein